jgi:hypothetical protein
MPEKQKHEKDAQRAEHLAGGLPQGLLCPGGLPAALWAASYPSASIN